MGIVFGAVAPHGWLAVPLLAGRDGAKTAATHSALAELGRVDLAPLLDLDPEAVARTRTEAMEPLLVLHGLVGGNAVRAAVISYEVPTYFGMAVAEFTPQRA